MPENDWYREAFGKLYPVLYPHRDDAAASREIGSLLELLRVEPDNGRVLDLACGNGRHTMALRDAGFDVYGLDLSSFLLGMARARSGIRERLVQGDVRDLPFQTAFRLVVNLFTSFGYFSDTENERALHEMARILKPGGILVLDHINTELLTRTLVEEDHRTSGGFHIRQRRHIHNRRVHKEITVSADGSGDRGFRSTIREDVRLYRPDEIEGLLRRASFQVIRMLGSFRGDPFDRESERMIVVARKIDAGEPVVESSE